VRKGREGDRGIPGAIIRRLPTWSSWDFPCKMPYDPYSDPSWISEPILSQRRYDLKPARSQITRCASLSPFRLAHAILRHRVTSPPPPLPGLGLSPFTTDHPRRDQPSFPSHRQIPRILIVPSDVDGSLHKSMLLISMGVSKPSERSDGSTHGVSR